MKLLIGTNNQHKIKEIKSIFHTSRPGALELITPEELGINIPEIEETGDTLEENAFIKANTFYALSGIASIADDTGLEIEALGGRPGVHSARFAGEQGADMKNRELALKLMEDAPDGKRVARFRTVICYVHGDEEHYIEGRCEGRITRRESGSEGFGYDPIFMPEGYDRTFAEMSEAEKNKISHRGRAVRNFVEFIKTKI